MRSLRPSIWMNDFSLERVRYGNAADLNPFSIWKSSHHQNSSRRSMRPNQLPICFVHLGYILPAYQVDMHPNDVAEVHPCRLQYTLNIA